MRFSIIIPTYNRDHLLKITADSLLSLESCPDDYEILIVDNGSKDNTREVALDIIGSNPGRKIRYFYEPIPGLLSARHRGALVSQGDILVFVDDDIEAVPGWLRAIGEAFQDPEVHLVGGKNLPKYESPPPDWLQAFWGRDGCRSWCNFISVLDFGEEVSEIDPRYVWGLNFSIRRETLFALGGFHPDYVPEPYQHYLGNAETGLAWKVKAAGFKLLYQPEAIVYHRIPGERLTIDYFKRRMFLFGLDDSYTRIRSKGGITFDWKAQKPLPQIRRLIRRIASRLNSDPYAVVKQKVREAWQDGYDFHRNKVRNEPELLHWVLKKDYWDYRYGPFLASPKPLDQK